MPRTTFVGKDPLATRSKLSSQIHAGTAGRLSRVGPVAGRVIMPLLLAAVAAAAILLFAIATSLRGPRVDRGRIYRVGYGNDVPLHFQGADGRPTGLAVDLVSEAARRARIQLQWINGPGFNQERMDFWVAQTITPERAKTVHLTEAYLQTESCLLVPAASPFKTVEDLRHARISHVNYAIHRANLSEMLPEATRVPAVDSSEALARMLRGDADATFINEYAIVETLLRGGHEPLRIIPAATSRSRLALASTFAQAAAADEIRAAMRDMAEDGVVARLLDQWAFFPKLSTDVVGELVVAHRRIQALVAGLLALLVIFAAAITLAILWRRRTRQLLRARRLLDRVADRVPGVVYQFRRGTDGTMCFPFASDAFVRIFGLAPDAVRHDASPVFALFAPEQRERVEASIRKSAADLSPWNLEFSLSLPDGTERWLAGNALPQREPDGATLWHGFITDVTERRRNEAVLQALERKVQETEKLESLGVLAGGIAHDFNNILAGIMGSVAVARLEPTSNPKLRTSLDQIHDCAQRAAGLCGQMLAYAGRGHFAVKPVALNRLVTDAVDLLHRSIGKETVLRFNLAHDLPLLEADAAQLRRVVDSLVSNAAEAIGAAGGMVHVNTYVLAADETFLSHAVPASELPPGKYVCLEVTDTGCGMAPETVARIFEPFFTTKFTGRGLGLAAVLGIVRRHGGVIWVDSAPERGSTFKVLFPIPAGPERSAAQTAPPPAK